MESSPGATRLAEGHVPGVLASSVCGLFSRAGQPVLVDGLGWHPHHCCYLPEGGPLSPELPARRPQFGFVRLDSPYQPPVVHHNLSEMLPRIGPCRAVLVHSPSRRMRPAAARAASSLLPFSTSGHFPGCLLNTPPLVVPAPWHTRADRAREHNRRPRTGAYSHAYSGAYSGAHSGP